MGVFDDYEPVPDLSCPVCGETLTGWQGKDAESILFVWRQYQSAPVAWRVDPDLRVPGVKENARLPPAFGIYTSDSKGHEVFADCAASDGVWTTTRVVAVTHGRMSRKGQFFRRLLWGSAPWLTKVTSDR
jgi:hypothetical protein